MSPTRREERGRGRGRGGGRVREEPQPIRVSINRGRPGTTQTSRTTFEVRPVRGGVERTIVDSEGSTSYAAPGSTNFFRDTLPVPEYEMQILGGIETGNQSPAPEHETPREEGFEEWGNLAEGFNDEFNMDGLLGSNRGSPSGSPMSLTPAETPREEEENNIPSLPRLKSAPASFEREPNSHHPDSPRMAESLTSEDSRAASEDESAPSPRLPENQLEFVIRGQSHSPDKVWRLPTMAERRAEVMTRHVTELNENMFEWLKTAPWEDIKDNINAKFFIDALKKLCGYNRSYNLVNPEYAEYAKYAFKYVRDKNSPKGALIQIQIMNMPVSRVKIMALYGLRPRDTQDHAWHDPQVVKATEAYMEKFQNIPAKTAMAEISGLDQTEIEKTPRYKFDAFVKRANSEEALGIINEFMVENNKDPFDTLQKALEELTREVPEGAMPEQTMPEQTMPEQTMQEVLTHEIPEEAIQDTLRESMTAYFRSELTQEQAMSEQAMSEQTTSETERLTPKVKKKEVTPEIVKDIVNYPNFISAKEALENKLFNAVTKAGSFRKILENLNELQLGNNKEFTTLQQAKEFIGPYHSRSELSPEGSGAEVTTSNPFMPNDIPATASDTLGFILGKTRLEYRRIIEELSQSATTEEALPKLKAIYPKACLETKEAALFFMSDLEQSNDDIVSNILSERREDVLASEILERLPEAAPESGSSSL